MITLETQLTPIKAYLEARGFPTDELSLQRLGLEMCGPERVGEVLGYKVGGGKVGLGIHYPGTDYTVVRMIPGGPLCPKGRIPEAYLPATLDWRAPKGTLYIAESALKALTLSRYGLQAMAAGGVSTVWMNSKSRFCEGWPHAALDSGDIERIIVAWDSDCYGGINSNVEQSLVHLSQALHERYPEVDVLVKHLPPPPKGYGKDSWGLDDYGQAVGDSGFEAWLNDKETLFDPPTDELTSQLNEMNRLYTVCHNPAGIIRLESGVLHSASVLRTVIEAPRRIRVGDNLVSIPSRWLTWDGRREVKELAFTPGAPLLHEDTYNPWKPGDVTPMQGDPAPFTSMLTDAVRDEEARTLLIQCMAWQLQNRGKKLHKLIYLVGREVGTGKSTIAEIMIKLLGERNTNKLTKEDFESQYNAAWSRRELAVFDDCEQMKKGAWAKMKAYVTGDRMNVTEKYMVAAEQAFYTVFYITANSADVIQFDQTERRILMVPFEPKEVHRNDDYWGAFYRWLEADGYAITYRYLLDLDLSTFNPEFYPPMNEVKESALDSVLDDDEAWLDELAHYGHDGIPEGRHYITSRELFILYKKKDIGPNDAGDLQAFVRKIGAKNYFSKAWKARVRIGKDLCNVYHVPARDKQQATDIKDLRANLEKYPLSVT